MQHQDILTFSSWYGYRSKNAGSYISHDSTQELLLESSWLVNPDDSFSNFSKGKFPPQQRCYTSIFKLFLCFFLMISYFLYYLIIFIWVVFLTIWRMYSQYTLYF